MIGVAPAAPRTRMAKQRRKSPPRRGSGACGTRGDRRRVCEHPGPSACSSAPPAQGVLARSLRSTATRALADQPIGAAVPWEPLTRDPVGRVPGGGGRRPVERLRLRPGRPRRSRISSPRTACRRRRATRSSTSRWSTRSAMKTIANFEQVLGRKMLWAERRRDDDDPAILERPATATCSGCGSTRTRCASRTPTTRRRRRRCCSATSTPPTTDPRDELPAASSSPASRTTSSRTR